MSVSEDFKTENRYLAIALLTILAVFISIAAWKTYLTPVLLAKKIVDHRSQAGMSDTKNAMEYGDEILDYLIQESDNFKTINEYNAGPIATMAGHYKGSISAKIGKDLAARKEDWSILAGIYILAANNEYKEPISNHSFIVRKLNEPPGTDSFRTSNPQQLAAEAIALINPPDKYEIFQAAIESGRVKYYNCDQIKDADPRKFSKALRMCLNGGLYSNYEEVAYKLLRSEGKETIDLLIDIVEDRSSFTSYETRQAVKILEEVTGQKFGKNRSEWQLWWSNNKETFILPDLSNFGTEKNVPRGGDLVENFKRAGSALVIKTFLMLAAVFLIPILIGYLVSRSINREITENKKRGKTSATKVYAGFWSRLSASFADSAILLLFAIILALCGFGSDSLISIILLSVAWCGYHIWFHGRFGATPGKMLNKIKVYSLDRRSITFKRAIYRQSIDMVFLVIGIAGAVSLYASGAYPEESGLPKWAQWTETASQIWGISECLVLLTNEKRRALHDFIAGTVVMHDPQ